MYVGTPIIAIPFTVTRERDTWFHLLQNATVKILLTAKRERITWFFKWCWLHVIIVYYWLQNAILCLGMWGQEWDTETSFNCPHSLWASVSGKVLRMAGSMDVGCRITSHLYALSHLIFYILCGPPRKTFFSILLQPCFASKCTKSFLFARYLFGCATAWRWRHIE